MSQTQRHQQQERGRCMPPRGSFRTRNSNHQAAGHNPTMQALPQDTLFVPPGSMFVLGTLGVLMGVLANLWQIFTSFSAFQHLFVTGAIYQHMDARAQSAALPIITVVCALVAVAFQLAILYLVFRVDRTWKETRAQGTGRATDAARHTAVEVMQHVPLLLIWGMLGFIADTVGDYTFISLYATAPFLQFMYGAALYASSTIMLVGAIEFLWAGMISFEKFKAWKRGWNERRHAQESLRPAKRRPEMHRHSKQGWTAAWAFVSFFLVMSLLTPWALAQGWGMSGLFFAMVGAASVAYLLPLLFRLFVRRLERQGIGLGEWGAFMAGGPPQALYVEAGNTPSTSLLPYEAMDEEKSDEEQALWEEEDETEEEQAIEQQASGWSPAPSRWTPDHEDDLLDLAPNLQVHPNTLLGGRVLVAGMPGSGKTNTMRRLMEECGKLGLPFLLIDTDGEYASLLPYLPSGVLVGGYHRLPVPLSRYTTITPSDALYFGEHILSEGWQVIVDIKSYEERPGHPDEALAAQVFMDIIHGMRAWAEARPPRERIPSMIFLEEAQVWLPQQPTSSALDKRTLRELQALFFRSARDGRRRGIGLVLVAHRIAGIHKEVLMCDWLILHQPQATDLKRYCELAPTVHRERFQRLTRGRAMVVSPRGTQEVAFHRASSQDHGVTPGVASATALSGAVRRDGTQ